MYNPQRLDTIRENIKLSKLLSDHEKSDWLNLLELMNDKQLGELEEILAAEAPVKKPVSETSAPASSVGSPTPAASLEKPVVVKEKIVEQPQAPVPHDLPVAPEEIIKQAQKTAPVFEPVQAPSPVAPPMPVSEPVQQSKLPPLSHLANIPSDIAKQNNLTQSGKSTVAVKEAPVKYAESPKPEAKAVAKPKFMLGTPEEIENISIETIRNFELQSVVDSIRTAIVEHGYFAILALVENSKLYNSYIESGKKLLQNEKAELTQSEFEFVTDLLRNMRFNRV